MTMLKFSALGSLRGTVSTAISRASLSASAGGISPQGNGKTIYACTRPLQDLSQDNSTGSASPEGSGAISHCYLKLVDTKTGKTLSSRSFFQDVGAAPEPALSGTCSVVKQHATDEDWDAAVSQINTHKKENYSVCKDQCCTATLDGLRKIPGFDKGAETKILSANKGIGTKYECIVQ